MKELRKGALLKPVMLLALAAVMAVLRPGMFLTPANLSSILLAVCMYGIMACGAIFPILNGGIDLSIGSVCALSGSVMVLTTLSGGSTTAATVCGIVLGITAGTLCGLFNGLISCLFAVPAFIVTLAAKNIVLGITQNLTNQNTIICLHSGLLTWLGSGKVFGVPFPIIFFLLTVGTAYFVLAHTRFGRYSYAVGGNSVASRYSGIHARGVSVSAYALSGFAAALTGILLSCFNRQAVATQGSSYDGDVLVALVVGGVSMAGGEGTIQGMLFGLLLMGMLGNAMVLLGVDAIYQDLIKGVIVIFAVAIDVYAKGKGNGLKKRHK